MSSAEALPSHRAGAPVPPNRLIAIVRALRDGAWVSRARVTRVCVLLAIAYAATWAFLLSGSGHLDPAGRAIGSDFGAFYASALAAQAGNAGALYSPATYAEMSAGWTGGLAYPWYYPPSSLLLFAPLALGSYGGALLAWILVGTATFLAAAWHIVPHGRTLLVAAAFPAVFVASIHGQSILLLAGCIGAGLLLLERSPIAAGALIGAAAAVKPHLVVLVPLAFLAGGQWRALLGLAAAVAASVVLSATAFGWQLWPAFVSSGDFARALIESGGIAYFKLQSTFAAVRLVGGGVPLAYVAQLLVAASAMGIVTWQWRRRGPIELRAAGLLVGGLLATPYAFDYDLVLAGLAVAFVTRAALRSGWVGWERSALAALWALPLLARPIAHAAHVVIAPGVLACVLFLVARRQRALHIDGAAGHVDRATSPTPAPAR